MKFVTNRKKESHLTVVLDNLKLFEEVYIAVAFLKVSGLNLLIQTISEVVKANHKVIIIAGQNFALTEPEALHTLRKLFKTSQTSKLYLAKTNHSRVFHPKLYLFKNNKDCCVISGSANITSGGLLNNQESSLVLDCSDTETVWIEAKRYFESLLSNDNAEEATLLAIKKYETFYEEQKAHNKKSKPFPTKSKSQLAFDYDSLLNHFKKFDNKERQDEFQNKTRNYKKARKVLDEIADNPRLTQKQFEPLLDSLVGSKEDFNLWHSGSLFRLRRKVYPYFKEFRELVKYIRENKDETPSIVFNNAKSKVKGIEGASVNYITEIMMTYNYQDFANMNKNPITVLRREGGVNIKASSESFTGLDYEEYCELVCEISEKLGLKNMLEADSFFNEIYWTIKP